MVDYSLKFAADTESGTRTLHFNERSVAGALDVAKKRARGNWAELYEGEVLVCAMELVDETGVWLVKGAASEGSHPQSSQQG